MKPGVGVEKVVIGRSPKTSVFEQFGGLVKDPIDSCTCEASPEKDFGQPTVSAEVWRRGSAGADIEGQ